MGKRNAKGKGIVGDVIAEFARDREAIQPALDALRAAIEQATSEVGDRRDALCNVVENAMVEVAGH
jgi:hypothetical protein